MNTNRMGSRCSVPLRSGKELQGSMVRIVTVVGNNLTIHAQMAERVSNALSVKE